jgi:FAD/FMN-containing dehydrogenase
MLLVVGKTANSLPLLSGWGRLPVVPAREILSEDLATATRGAVLTRGLGRSYGDSSLPPPGVDEVVSSILADRVIAFDPESGLLRAEAGLALSDLVWTYLPRGFFPPVTPGTQFVTLGGMVASDVHGKNHHVAGTIGRHVTALKLRLADDSILECSREHHPDLFRATVGGMGLTGHILEVELTLQRVPSPWIWTESERVDDLDSYVRALKRAAGIWPYTVGWIDCLSTGPGLGRGYLTKGRWALPHEAPPEAPRPKRRITVPFDLPSFLLNALTVRVFNQILWTSHLDKVRSGIAHPESFFYPLDAIRAWNRLYGKPGFTQYQCVLPDDGDGAAARARRFLERLSRLGGASFLCVIKDCGEEGDGLLSFPRPGISIALDIPHRAGTQELVDRLNELVIAEGGRIYLTKDAFTRPEHFRAMEPRLPEFERVRDAWDPEHRLRSRQSERVLSPRLGPT